MPPLLLTVGSDEGLLNDSLRFAEKTKAAGVDLRLIIGSMTKKDKLPVTVTNRAYFLKRGKSAGFDCRY